jgi:hypothetical protein
MTQAHLSPGVNLASPPLHPHINLAPKAAQSRSGLASTIARRHSYHSSPSNPVALYAEQDIRWFWSSMAGWQRVKEMYSPSLGCRDERDAGLKEWKLKEEMNQVQEAKEIWAQEEERGGGRGWEGAKRRNKIEDMREGECMLLSNGGL